MSDYDRANRLHVEKHCNYLLRHPTGRAGAVEGGTPSVVLKSRASTRLMIAAFLERFSASHISGKMEYDTNLSFHLFHFLYSFVRFI